MEVHQSGGGVVSQASAANAVHSYQDIALLQPHSLRLARRPYLHTYIHTANSTCYRTADSQLET